jgi:antitoxin component YwqK of YwqJK toxin-antitoxin module
MKYKSTLFIVCALTISLIHAQNLTLAKAFYKKAQQEYSNKNYTQVFILLDKTKEQLGGESNPEITYLEGKAHFNSDLNVSKAKKLLTKFLEEANPNDSRIDEISSIIVDIEVSDKIDKYGNFNDLTGRSGIKTSYYDTGEKEWVQEYVNGVKNGFIRRYNKAGILIQSGTQKNGYVTGFYEWFYNDGKLWYTNNYDQYGKKTKEEKVYNTKGQLIYVYTFSNGKKNGLYNIFFETGNLWGEGNYDNDKLNGKYTVYYPNGKIKETYIYSNKPSYDTKTPSFIEGLKTSYYNNGIKSSEENYIKGKKQGIQKYYHENGNIKRWEHLNAEGKYYGQRAHYYKSNGKRAININYENGKAIELLEQVDVTGKKLRISKLKKGNGYIKRVNDAGVIVYEAIYVDGLLHGEETYYDENGEVSTINRYKNGKFLGGTVKTKD